MNKDFLELDYISVEEAARLAGVNPATIFNAINRGEMTAIKGVDKSIRLTRAWVNAWIASKVVNPDRAGGDAA